MSHPNSLALEAFACGEKIASVASHLDECTTCGAFVERLRGALSAGPSRARAKDVVAKAAALVDETPRGERTPRDSALATARRRWFVTASTIAVPLAAAAALVFLVRTPTTRESIIPAEPPRTVAEPSATTPEITFKGGMQVAIIRERAGEQTRFTDRVQVRPGDRLRVEVALDREQDILAAIMGDDASWLELMPGGTRRPGTHFSDRAARVDATPLQGTVLVGAPDAIARARATHRFDGVAVIRVEWEAP